MGCAPSSRTDAEKRDSSTDGAKQVDPPPIPVHVGSGVHKARDLPRSVIFVFGGPGSQKGIVTEALVKGFDFISINVEEIVFSYLPSKLANTVETTVDIQDLLRRDQGVVSVEWVLSMVSAKLSTSMSERFVVDLIPSLGTILKSDSFKERNQDKHLEAFERRHAILCALEINVADERALVGTSKEGSEKKNEKELSPELSAFIRGADEADKGRLEKRMDAYHRCASPFLSYFQRTRRVLRVDISSKTQPRQIVDTLFGVFVGLGFSNNNEIPRAVLFVYNERQIADVEFDAYRMQRVRLSDLTTDTSQPLTVMLRALRRYINTTARSSDSFLVLLDSIREIDTPKDKRTAFLETQLTYLDLYFKRKTNGSNTKRHRVALQAITCSRSEVCLFPQSMSAKMCRSIGYAFSEGSNSTDVDVKPPQKQPSHLLSRGSYANGTSVITDYLTQPNPL